MYENTLFSSVHTVLTESYHDRGACQGRFGARRRLHVTVLLWLANRNALDLRGVGAAGAHERGVAQIGDV